MNELINGFRNVLNAYLAGRAELSSLERELVTCIKQEPDFTATYSALIEARHRTGHLSEEAYLRLMQSARVTLQACMALMPRVADDASAVKRAEVGPHSGKIAYAATGGASPASANGSNRSEFHSRNDATRLPPQPGSIIKNRFELMDVIGRGGMGVVFKARDRLKEEAGDRNPFVALKIIAEELRRHSQAFRALQREARKAQKLAHPNIATVFDFERDGDIVFMHMEWLEGESLERLIHRHDGAGLPVNEALRITEGLCAALAYAHQQNIIHSDFKPANAYVTRDGAVKVLDFGIARASKPRTARTPHQAATTLFDPRSLGALTPAYASCEMIEGQEPDPRDDVYALAVVTYELLTGRHPFRQLSAVHARDAELTPRPIPGLPKRQWQALRHGLAFNRDDRTPTVQQFLAEMTARRTSAFFWSRAIAASVVTFTLLGAGALWSVIVLMDQHLIRFERAADLDSAEPLQRSPRQPLPERKPAPAVNAQAPEDTPSAPETPTEVTPTVAQVQARIDELLAERRLTSPWTQQIRVQLALLATRLPPSHPDVVAAKERVSRAYLTAAQAARERRDMSRASWLLSRARELAPYLPDIQQEDERLLSLRASVEEANEQEQRETERNDLKRRLLAQAQAREVVDALDTLAKLKVLLEPTDPFIHDARNEIAQAYLDLAEDAEKENRRVDAVNLVRRAAELAPDSKRVQLLRARYNQARRTRDAPLPDATRVAQREAAAETAADNTAPDMESSAPPRGVDALPK